MKRISIIIPWTSFNDPLATLLKKKFNIKIWGNRFSILLFIPMHHTHDPGDLSFLFAPPNRWTWCQVSFRTLRTKEKNFLISSLSYVTKKGKAVKRGAGSRGNTVLKWGQLLRRNTQWWFKDHAISITFNTFTLWYN